MNADQLAKVMPKAPRATLDILVAAMQEFGIDTAQRQAMFVATIATESGQLTTFSENLNYSPEALVRVFGKYFPTIESTVGYAHNPERIANKVYANRGGNGSELSGDGWRYRGSGSCQLTFYDNHWACAKYFSILLSRVSDWMRTPEGAIRSGAWHWKASNVNRYADINDFDGACDIINRGKKTLTVGDSNGWAQRLAYFNLANKAMA